MRLPHEIKATQVVTVEINSGTPQAICEEHLWSGIFPVGNDGMFYMPCMRPDLVLPARRNANGYHTDVLLPMLQVTKHLQMRH